MTPQTALPETVSMGGKVMGIIDELTRLMDEETPLIEARDFGRHAALIKRKQELTLDYQATLKVIAENPASLAGLNEAQRSTLRGAGERLDHAARRNADALNLAARASERLMQAIMDEVRRTLHNEGGYSRNGHLALQASAKSKPVAFNEKV